MAARDRGVRIAFFGLVEGFRVVDRQPGVARVVWSTLATFVVSGFLLFVAVRDYVGAAVEEGGRPPEY
jgi:hypothetical protein